METTVLQILLLLAIKHFICDFVLQTKAHIAHKGTYGNRIGINHSLIHGAGTGLALIPFLNVLSIKTLLLFIVLDALFHYHIDWVKQNISAKYKWTPHDDQFWCGIGMDQLAHFLTYIGLIWLLIVR